MIAKKIILFAGVLMVGSLFHQVRAQDQQLMPIDKKAKGILDALSKKTKSYKTIKAEFTFNMYNKDKKVNETQKGKIQIKGQKYKLEIKGQEIISDNKNVWTYLKDANEVQVNNVDVNSNDGINPTTIFTIYDKGFKYRYDHQEKDGNTVVDVIDLYPKRPDRKKYHTVKLMVDKKKNQITAIKMLMKDGSVYTYTITSFKTNEAIADSVFTFDPKKYPGVEVTDLRE